MVAVLEMQSVGDLAGEPTRALEAEVRSLAAEIAAATCRLLLLVGELDRREAWREWGCRSCAHWLAWQCGTSSKTGYEHARVGRALGELPEITAAFSTGRLSYSKVRALTRVATADTERVLVELALDATASQLDRIVSSYERARRLADPDLGAARLARRAVWSEGNDDGTRTIHLRVTSEVAGLIESAIETALTEVPELVDRPDEPAAARRADAMEVVARSYLTPAAAEHRPADLVVHADIETLVADRPGRSEMEPGGGLCAETARRLACDARLTLSVEHLGSTLDVGRRTRTVSPALRRALIDRDRGCCRFPGCTNTRRLQAHHRRHWARGGATSRANLVLLCPFHHRTVHEGGWNVEGDLAGLVTFVGPKGRRVAEIALAPPPTDSGALRRGRVRAGTVIPRDAARGRWTGDVLDLDLAITAMVSLDDRCQALGLDRPDSPSRFDGHG